MIDKQKTVIKTSSNIDSSYAHEIPPLNRGFEANIFSCDLVMAEAEG